MAQPAKSQDNKNANIQAKKDDIDLTKEFLNDSAAKKLYYSQFNSVSDAAHVNSIGKIDLKKWMFVLSLKNLGDLIDGNMGEIELLQKMSQNLSNYKYNENKNQIKNKSEMKENEVSTPTKPTNDSNSKVNDDASKVKPEKQSSDEIKPKCKENKNEKNNDNSSKNDNNKINSSCTQVGKNGDTSIKSNASSNDKDKNGKNKSKDNNNNDNNNNDKLEQQQQSDCFKPKDGMEKEMKEQDINVNGILDTLCEKIASIHQVSGSSIKICDIYYGSSNFGYMIQDSNLCVITPSQIDEYVASCQIEFSQFYDLVIAPIPDTYTQNGASHNNNNSDFIRVTSYHVACLSQDCSSWHRCNNCDNNGNNNNNNNCGNCGNYRGINRNNLLNCNLNGHNLGGIVLYMKNNSTDWYCNRRHCKTGYIIIMPIELIQNIQSRYGQIHGKLYKYVFNQEPCNVVGSGFARRNGQWAFNSGVFNSSNDDFHDNSRMYNNCHPRTMNNLEQKWVNTAIENWFNSGNQNTVVNENVVIFKNQSNQVWVPISNPTE